MSAPSIVPKSALSKSEGKERLAVLRIQRESGVISEAEYKEQKRLVKQAVAQSKCSL